MNKLELMKTLQQYRNKCEEKKSIADYLIDLPENFEKQDLEVQRQYKRQAVESLMSITEINEFQYIDKICNLIPQDLSRRLIQLYTAIETNSKFEVSMIKSNVFIIVAIFLVEYLKKNELDIIDEYHVLERILSDDEDYDEAERILFGEEDSDINSLKELYECLVKYYTGYQNDKDRYALSPKCLNLLTLPLLNSHSQYMEKLVNKIIRTAYNNKIYPVACLDRIHDIYFSASNVVKTVIDDINHYFDITYKSSSKEFEPIKNYVISFLLEYKKLPTSEELETFIGNLDDEQYKFKVKIVPLYPSKTSEINTCSVPCAVDMVSQREASFLVNMQKEMPEDLRCYKNEVIIDEKRFIRKIKIFNQAMDKRRTSQREAFNADNYDSNELVPIAYCFINGVNIPYSIDIEPNKLKEIIRELAQPQIKKSKIKVKSLKYSNPLNNQEDDEDDD